MSDITIETSEPAFSRWYPTENVRKRAAGIYGEENAPGAIWPRIKAGVIRAASGSASIQKNYDPPTPHLAPQIIPASVWRYGTRDEIPPRIWLGDAHFALDTKEDDGTPYTMYVEAFGIRLHPVDVDREFPLATGDPAPQTTGALAAQLARGGRLPAAWWDDLWIEMCRQIYAGDLGPDKIMAEIEGAMDQWAQNNEHKASEGT